MKVILEIFNDGSSKKIDLEITETQYDELMRTLGKKSPAVSEAELREKMIAALAEQVELVGRCDNAADAQIMEAKFKVLNDTLRTLDKVDGGWRW